jgi:hypothetical protein
MNKNIDKNCIKHGITKHTYTTDNRYRCNKCQCDAVQKRRLQLKQRAIDYKGGKCIICNYNKYNGALEFHHLDPDIKDFNISKNGATRCWKKMVIELDKCVLLCSNCHKEVHAGLITIPQQ